MEFTFFRKICPKTQEERKCANHICYALTVGSLMYSMLCTRPDIMYIVSFTRKYQSNTGLEYWILVKNILMYLRRTKDLFLVYRGKELKLEGFTNFDFQSNIDDRMSTSRFIFTCNGRVFY